MRQLVNTLRTCAVLLRQGAALGSLVLAIRVLWLSGLAGLAHARSEANDSPREASIAVARTQAGAPNPYRPDLEKLSEMIGRVESEPPDVPPAPVPSLRRILVDVGPPRSEVFVGKTKVGHTPYGGQIACIADEEIKIQILPPQGVPILRRVTCRGDTLLVQE